MFWINGGERFGIPKPVAFNGDIKQLAHRCGGDRVGVQIAHASYGKCEFSFGQAVDVRYSFTMQNWPNRIPPDLHNEIESRRVDDWEAALRAWAKTHGLKLKLQWWRQLEITIADLHSRRYTAKPQDYWSVFKEWLERHYVPAPEKLPGWSEQN